MQWFVRRRIAAGTGLFAGPLLVVGLLGAGPADAITWTVPLSGQAVIDSHLPASAGGSGTATITADDSANRVCGTFTWSGVASPVVAGHIHEGQYGQPENPGVTINLFGPNINRAASSVLGYTTLADARVRDMDRQ